MRHSQRLANFGEHLLGILHQVYRLNVIHGVPARHMHELAKAILFNLTRVASCCFMLLRPDTLVLLPNLLLRAEFEQALPAKGATNSVNLRRGTRGTSRKSAASARQSRKRYAYRTPRTDWTTTFESHKPLPPLHLRIQLPQFSCTLATVHACVVDPGIVLRKLCALLALACTRQVCRATAGTIHSLHPQLRPRFRHVLGLHARTRRAE